MAASTFLDNFALQLFPRRKEYVSFREAAELTSLSERTLRRAHKEGRLEARRVGCRWIVSKESLDKFLS